jgi:hypothetical protein
LEQIAASSKKKQSIEEIEEVKVEEKTLINEPGVDESNVSVLKSDECDDDKFKNELKEVILRNKNESATTINDSSSTTTTTDTNEDEEEEVEKEDEEKKNFIKIKETFIKNEIKQNNNKYTKSNSTNDLRKRSIGNTNTSLNNQNILFSDSVLISKINLNKIENNEEEEEEEKKQSMAATQKIWERKWIQLTDDGLLSVYSCQNESQPKDLLNLINFELININETTFELKRENLLQKQNRVKTKSFINLFEYTNYELKFLKNENKTILFNLIKDLITSKK